MIDHLGTNQMKIASQKRKEKSVSFSLLLCVCVCVCAQCTCNGTFSLSLSCLAVCALSSRIKFVSDKSKLYESLKGVNKFLFSLIFSLSFFLFLSFSDLAKRGILFSFYLRVQIERKRVALKRTEVG